MEKLCSISLLLFVILLDVSCSKQETSSNLDQYASKSYFEAHTFVGDSAIIKDGYLPTGSRGQQYSQCNFEQHGQGYYYTSLKDTPWLYPMYFSLSIGNPVSSNWSAIAGYDELYVNGGSIETFNGLEIMFGSGKAHYLRAKSSANSDSLYCLNIRGYPAEDPHDLSYWTGVVDKQNKTITFEVYILKSSGLPPQIYDRPSMMQWMADGHTDNPNITIEVVKKLSNIRFKYAAS